MEKKDNWLFDVLLPTMCYRLARSVSYDEFIQRIHVRKVDYYWRDCIQSDKLNEFHKLHKNLDLISK